VYSSLVADPYLGEVVVLASVFTPLFAMIRASSCIMDCYL